MQKILPLMQREWLQHRFGWALAMLIPLGLAAVLTAFGQVELDADTIARAGDALPLMLAMSAIAISALLLFTILSVTSGIIVAGLARRDHADRSIEFWLSVPVGHAQSLAVPLAVHLLSPGGRVVQVTSDLPGFWSGTWKDVRRELAGRYPKHNWPLDPTTAEPGGRPNRQR